MWTNLPIPPVRESQRCNLSCAPGVLILSNSHCRFP
uniref:Uncharacterized protein n=1 Tax=Setaria italica TaxID=4555 RepID=K3YFM6_SETIT